MLRLRETKSREVQSKRREKYSRKLNFDPPLLPSRQGLCRLREETALRLAFLLRAVRGGGTCYICNRDSSRVPPFQIRKISMGEYRSRSLSSLHLLPGRMFPFSSGQASTDSSVRIRSIARRIFRVSRFM